MLGRAFESGSVDALPHEGLQRTQARMIAGDEIDLAEAFARGWHIAPAKPPRRSIFLTARLSLVRFDDENRREIWFVANDEIAFSLVIQPSVPEWRLRASLRLGQFAVKLFNIAIGAISETKLPAWWGVR